MGPEPQHQQVPGSLPCLQSHLPRQWSPTLHSAPKMGPKPTVTPIIHSSCKPYCHLLCGQPRAGRGGHRDESDPDPALEMLPGLGGGDRHVIKKASKGEHLQAIMSAGLWNENKLQDRGRVWMHREKKLRKKNLKKMKRWCNDFFKIRKNWHHIVQISYLWGYFTGAQFLYYVSELFLKKQSY